MVEENAGKAATATATAPPPSLTAAAPSAAPAVEPAAAAGEGGAAHPVARTLNLSDTTAKVTGGSGGIDPLKTNGAKANLQEAGVEKQLLQQQQQQQQQQQPAGRTATLPSKEALYAEAVQRSGRATQSQSAKDPNLKLHCELKGHENAVACVKFNQESTLLASCGADMTIRVWETAIEKLSQMAGTNGSTVATSGKAVPQMKHLIKFQGHKAGVNDVSWDPGSKFLVSASDDKTLIIWSIDSKDKVKVLEGHTTYVFCCCFNPQGTIIASGSFDETIRLWNVKDGKCMRELPAHSDPVTSVDFNRDGTMLVSSSHDGLCRVWDTANGHCLKTLIDDSSPPVAFAKFSPNGKFILVGALDNHIRLWSYLDSGKCMKTYTGHKNEKFCLFQTFLIHEETSATKYIVSGSEDNHIFLWDLNSKEIVQCIKGHVEGETNNGHTGAVLAVSTDSNFRIASAGLDQVIKIWGK